MVNQRLVDYIKFELSKGVSLQQIRQNLLARGWPEYEIDEAMSLAIQQKNFPPLPGQTTYEEPQKKFSKLWIIPVIIVFVLIIGGVLAFFILMEKEPEKATATKPTQKSTKPSEPSGLIDCGTNMDCFITASQNCKLAKVTYTMTVDIFGVKQTTTSYFEIKGLEGGKCVFYLRTEKIDLTFPPETPQHIIEQQKEIYKKLEGRDGSCKFNTNDLTMLLKKWKDGNLSGGASCTFTGSKWECTYTGDWEIAQDCKGSIFSQEL